MPDPLTIASIVELGKGLISRLWPDPAKQAEELRKLQELEQKGDLARLSAHVQLMLGQIEVNKAEAEHKSIFIAGWRPFIGWVGGTALAWQFVLYPMALWIWGIAEVKGVIPAGVTPPPVLDSDMLFVLITGMLGIGGMRSFDKTRNTDTKKIGR